MRSKYLEKWMRSSIFWGNRSKRKVSRKRGGRNKAGEYRA